jgi:hypothetical protein
MALDTQIKLRAHAVLTGSAGGTTPQGVYNQSVSYSWPSGTGLSQADLVHRIVNGTIAASANTDLDLAGSFAGMLGTTTFARVKAVILTAPDTNTNNVVMGAAATNTWVGPFGAATHTVSCPPGGCIPFINPTAAGWPVTATTADLLRLANSGAGSAVTYSLLLIGASA